jgi:hypothetical protein
MREVISSTTSKSEGFDLINIIRDPFIRMNLNRTGVKVQPSIGKFHVAHSAAIFDAHVLETGDRTSSFMLDLSLTTKRHKEVITHHTPYSVMDAVEYRLLFSRLTTFASDESVKLHRS